MNEFTYQNIFETKGVEYLVIIGFLLLLVPFWLMVNKRAGIRQQIKEKLAIITASVLEIPRGLYYSRFHSWAYLEPAGDAKVGIDDFLVKATGQVRFIPMVKEGSKVEKGEIIGQITQNDKNLPVKSPVSGKIMQVHSELKDNSSLLYNDPYKSGWMYSISPSNWKEETQGYFLAEDAVVWIQTEVERLKDFLSEKFNRNTPGTIPVIYQEGGEIRQDILSEMDSSGWKAFQEEFL